MHGVITAVAALALLPHQAPVEIERKAIGKSGLYMNLPFAALRGDDEAALPDGVEEREILAILDFDGNFSGVAIHQKQKGAILPADVDHILKTMLEKDVGGGYAYARKFIFTPKKGSIMAVEHNGKEAMGAAVTDFFRYWIVTLDYKPTAENRAKAKQMLESIQFGTPDTWKHWRLESSKMDITLPGSPRKIEPITKGDYWETTSSWRRTSGELEVLVTYMKAKEGRPFETQGTFDTLVSFHKLAHTKQMPAEHKGVRGEQIGGSYVKDGQDRLMRTILLTRGKEGWDIRMFGPSTILTAELFDKVAASITPHSSEASGAAARPL